MRAHQNTWERVSRARKMGYRTYIAAHTKMGRGMGQGCLQLCRWVGTTLLHMCETFFHPNDVADNCDIISWHHCCPAYDNWGEYKERWMHETEEFGSSLGFGRLDHRFFVSAILVPPWGVGILNRLGSVHYLFITTVYTQGLPGWLDFMYFSCLCVNWVACHPARIEPRIREARTRALWSGVHIRGKLQTQWAHWSHPACPGHIYNIYNVLSNYGDPQYLW